MILSHSPSSVRGREGGRGDGKLIDRAGDAQAGPANGGDVIRDDVDERDVVSGALQVGAGGAADGAGAPDQNAMLHHQFSISARVSSIATAQIASISLSLRCVRPP